MKQNLHFPLLRVALWTLCKTALCLSHHEESWICGRDRLNKTKAHPRLIHDLKYVFIIILYLQISNSWPSSIRPHKRTGHQFRVMPASYTTQAFHPPILLVACHPSPDHFFCQRACSFFKSGPEIDHIKVRHHFYSHGIPWPSSVALPTCCRKHNGFICNMAQFVWTTVLPHHIDPNSFCCWYGVHPHCYAILLRDPRCSEGTSSLIRPALVLLYLHEIGRSWSTFARDWTLLARRYKNVWNPGATHRRPSDPSPGM